jgi:CRP-like cAMP-binding protein
VFTYANSRNPVTQWSEPEAAQALHTWRRLLNLGPVQRYREKAVLFYQGDPVRDLILISRGMVKVTFSPPDGDKLLSRLRYPGQFVEQCACDLGVPSPVSATAIVPCEVHRIDLARINEARVRNLEVGAFEKYILKRDLYNAHAANIELQTLTPARRLERLLSQLATVLGAHRSSGPVEFVLPLDNVEMASILGLSQTHYKQIRGELEDQGRLGRQGRRVVLTKPHDIPLASVYESASLWLPV